MKQASIKKNTFYNALKTFSSILFPLITFPYISRVLQPENVGRINFGLSIVSYFSLIATLGITTYAIRECSAIRDDKDQFEKTASQIYSINIITTIVAYLALIIVLLFYHHLDSYRTLIIVQSFTIVATTLGTDWLNSAMEDFKYITFRTLVFQLVSLILMFIFVHKPEDYMIYVMISVISSAGANITNIWYRRRYCRVTFIWDTKDGIMWKRHSVPILLLFVMILAQNIYSNVDTTMLGLMYGDREVGIYTTARKIASLLFQVIVSIAWVVMPRMSYYFEEQKITEANELFRKVFGFYFLVGLPCLVGGAMISEDIITIIAGIEYQEAAYILRIMIVGFIFDLFGASLIGNIIFLPSNREKTYMLICGLTAVINVVTNFIFIPVYSTIAAASTTAFCNLIMFILFFLTRDKRIKLKNVTRTIVTPIVGSLSIVFICIISINISNIWTRMVVVIVVSVLFYVLIQWIGKNDLFINIVEEILEYLKPKFEKKDN